MHGAGEVTFVTRQLSLVTSSFDTTIAEVLQRLK